MSILQYKKPEKELGKHYIVEYMDCDSAKLSHVAHVEQAFLDAAEKSNATIINHTFHQFQPQGVSGIVLIAESHFSIHTWPEHGYASVDIFTCGEEMNPDIAVHTLKKHIDSKKMKVYIVERGLTNE